MYLNFADPKINIFRDLRVFVLALYPKTKTRKSRKFMKKPQNTEMREFNFKNPGIIVQITFSK